MALFNKSFRNLFRFFGPSGGEVVTCSFSLVTTALTAIEQAGCTVSRTTTGTYVVQLLGRYKHLTVGMSVQAASTAQLFIITARDLTAGTITIQQVTAGGGTAVDTLTARVDLVIVGRKNS